MTDPAAMQRCLLWVIGGPSDLAGMCREETSPSGQRMLPRHHLEFLLEVTLFCGEAGRAETRNLDGRPVAVLAPPCS